MFEPMTSEVGGIFNSHYNNRLAKWGLDDSRTMGALDFYVELGDYSELTTLPLLAKLMH